MKALRAFRVLRPLRLVSGVPSESMICGGGRGGNEIGHRYGGSLSFPFGEVEEVVQVCKWC